MAFVSFQPRSEFLKRFVAYYYIDGSDDPNYRNSYLFYPHVNTTLSFYKNAACRLDETTAVITAYENVKYLKLVTQQSQAHRATQIGRTNKIAVVFKPLGLNRFITESYAALVPRESQIFETENDAEWNHLLERLFAMKDIDDKTASLDEFLLRQFNGYEHPFLEQAIALLSDPDNDWSIAEIAESLSVSRKTLLRHFKSELRISPELFRIIVRFRHALNEKVLAGSLATLTQLAYKANFFDQSYFIRNFRQLTGATPTQFFKEGIRLGSEDTFWTFESKLSEARAESHIAVNPL